MTGRTCRIAGCQVLVSSGPGMCSRHLSLLPRLLREQLWSYRGKEPSPEVVAAAMATVAERERVTGGELKPVREIELEGDLGRLWNNQSKRGQ